MPFESLDAALAAGAVIVTPNNRLARAAVMRHDAAQRRGGRPTWAAARALPWGAFVDVLWADAIGQGGNDAIPVAPAAALHAWQAIIESDPMELLDRRGAARSAAEAYGWFHAYRQDDEHWRAWQASGIADDAAAFARWATRYGERLDSRGFVDRAELADRLVRRRTVSTGGAPVALLGFTQRSPQQQRLLDALAAGGTDVSTLPPPRRAARCARVACESPTDELMRALAFARAHAERAADARIGIVVQDLGARRSEVIALADEILAPGRLMPLAPHATAPYGVSLGVPLAEVPIVAAALDLLALLTVGLDATHAAALLRSPYLPGDAQAWQARAYVERTWREQGRRRLRANDAAATLDRIDAGLAQRLRAPLRRQAAASRDWVSTWSAWLDAFGWPGARALDSAEWQARDAWHALLRAFAALDEVTTTLDAARAFEALRSLAGETVWSPQSGAAPIQIMGVLEASGLDFDALWLAGFSAEAWPPAPNPNPFLPLAWQRARNTPRSSAAGALAYARALSDDFAQAANEVVASHARAIDEAPQVASPLFAHWPERAMPEGTARLRDRIAAADVRPLAWRDDAGPPLPMTADAGGGTGVIESQSACPFQAFARYRLNARGWDEPDEGLTPKERGTLLHFAMRAFWDEIREHAALAALDDAALEARVARAVEAAKAKLPAPRWRALAPAVAAGETQRLTQTIVAWLVLHELPRPAFRVLMTERDTALTLGGVRLRLKIDRADTLEAGALAVLDYKSGRVTGPTAWFRPRPEGTQLGLYVLALKAAVPTRPVSAAAYAQIKAGQIKVSGVVADGALWPQLTPPHRAAKDERAKWRDLEQFWMDTLTDLGAEFQRGCAGVTPRNAQACQRCDLQPLCRIRNLYDDALREPVVTDEDE
jgi:ATP-dependent helicase/nuclease subunit B